MNIFKRILFGSLWFAGILVCLFIAGSNLYTLFGVYRLGGLNDPEISYHFGREFASHYTGMILLVSLMICVVLSMLGILPGTNPQKRDKKVSLWSVFSLIFGLLFFLIPTSITMGFGVLVMICGIVGFIRTVKFPEKLSGKAWAMSGTGLWLLTLLFPNVVVPLVVRNDVLPYNEAVLFSQMLREERVLVAMKQRDGIPPLEASHEAENIGESDRELIISQIMELSQIRALFKRLAQTEWMSAATTPHGPSDQIAAIRQIEQGTYTPERLKQYVYDALQKYYDSARFGKYAVFLKTPLVRRYMEEKERLLDSDDEALRKEAELSAQKVHSYERYQLVSDILRMSVTPRLQIALSSYGRIPMLKTTDPALSTEQIREELTVLIDEYGFPQQEGAMPDLLSQEAFISRNFSDEELEQYLSYLLYPEIRFVEEAIYQSIVEALSHLRQDFLNQARASVEEVDQPITNRVYGALRPDETLTRKREIAEYSVNEGLNFQDQGDQERMKRNLRKAAVLLEQLVILDPEDSVLRSQLAKTYQALGFRVNRAEVLLMNQ